MNNERILRVLNSFMILIGYRLHGLEVEERRFRLSFWGILSYICFVLIYAISVNEYFGNSSLLHFLNSISPFLWNLTRFQVFMGVKVCIFLLCEFKHVNRAANGILEVISTSNIQRSKYSLNEAIAYMLMFSTFLICLCFGLYIAYEMEFYLPPVDHILVALSLFLPHFAVAGALKWFNITTWLYRAELCNLATNLDDLILPLTEIKDDKSTITIAIFGQTEVTHSEHHTSVHGNKILEDIHRRLDKFALNYSIFNAALRKQLTLLICLNGNCLLFGVYSLVYFESTWNVIFMAVQKRIFYTANIGIFVFILSDYLCMCGVMGSFDSVKSKFLRSVDHTLNRHDPSLKLECLTILKQIRNILKHRLNFILWGPLHLNSWNIILINKCIAAVIAIIVMYNYLNDKIVLLSDLLDTTDDAQ